MRFSDLIRWGALAGGVGAIVGGVAYATMPIEPLVWDEAVSYAEQRIIITQLGSLIGIAGLYAVQRGRYSPLATAAYLLASCGTALILVSVVALLIWGPSVGPEVLYSVGIGALTATIGLVLVVGLVGAEVRQRRVVPRWVGAVMIVGIPAAVLIFLITQPVVLMLNLALGLWLSLALGLILLGLVWVMVGYVLLQMGARRFQQPTRVR